jgi:DnaA family protein
VSGQLPLPLTLAPHARFETFVSGVNRPVVLHLQSRERLGSHDAIWIWGAAGVGKSHLLQAACAAQSERRAIYLPLAELEDLDPGLLDGLENLDLVAVDDVDGVARSADWNRALFALFNGVAAEGGRLLLSAAGPPVATPFCLPDLASRAAAAAVYQLASLADDDLVTALRLRAESRGLDLSEAAARYLVTRVERNMSSLCNWLETLDRASLAAQRKITIPLIREALTRGSADGAAVE